MTAHNPSLLDAQRRRDAGVLWMNRGHELQYRGDPASLEAAIHAYGEAITLLSALPLTDHPEWALSLGAAHMNLGQLLHRAHGVNRAAEALGTLERAIAILLTVPAEATPWPRRNLAGSFLNRANLYIDLGRLAEAERDAREALQRCVEHAHEDLVDADLTLKSRRALCDVLGQYLVTQKSRQATLIAEASDLVDDSLSLIRQWSDRGETPFQPLAQRFFHYGTQLYRVAQPHFLAEFIEENLVSAGPECHQLAVAQVNAALNAVQPPGILTMGEAATERFIRTTTDLTDLRARLNSLISDR